MAIVKKHYRPRIKKWIRTYTRINRKPSGKIRTDKKPSITYILRDPKTGMLMGRTKKR